MNEGLTASQSKFHEIPLVLFSAVFVMGCGTGATHLLFWAFGIAAFLPPSSLPNLITVLLATGLIVSLAHLGRPQGMFDTVRRVGRSRLSDEVILGGLALLGSGLCSVLPESHPLFAPIWLLTLLACSANLLFLGAVYRLPGHPGWGGPVAFQPATTGLVVGGILWGAAVSLPWPGRYAGMVAVFILLDVSATVWRMLALHRSRRRATPDHPWFFRLRNVLLPTRVILVDLLPMNLMILGLWRTAILSLVLGVFLDRTVFYGLGLKKTTEAEITRVETILAGG